MKECDRVILTVERKEYAKYGVHKGMDGLICDPRCIENTRLVCFDQYGDLPNIAIIEVKEKDLEVMKSTRKFVLKTAQKLNSFQIK